MSLKPKIVEFDTTWSAIKDTIAAVITLRVVDKGEWNERFSDVYSLCVAWPIPCGDRLYNETKAFLEQHVRGMYEELSSLEDSQLLHAYHQRWMEYSRGAEYMHFLFGYLNSQHIKNNKISEADLTYGGPGMEAQEQMLEIGELGLDVWKREMINLLRHRLVNLLLDSIRQDRQGRVTNHVTVQGVINSFVTVEKYKQKNLELYESIFVEPFLKDTGEYYRLEASNLLQENTLSQYMEKVIVRLEEENLRSKRYLHHTSGEKVIKECRKRMVADHLSRLNSESVTMVKGERRAELKNLYTLLQPLQEPLGAVAKTLEEHIRERGMAVIGKDSRGDNAPSTLVENVLGVYRTYNTLVTEVFSKDQSFIGAMDRAMQSIINYRPNPQQLCKTPEMLAKYCDNLLKKSSKGLSENETDERLASTITVFKYIEDKDVFQKFYSRMLAKRLIHQQSCSMDAEEAMINRLKQACGYEFTNKLHRMFTDVSVSGDLCTKFGEHLRKEKIQLSINFQIQVLQAGAWPLGQTTSSTFAVPQELEKSIGVFENFYHQKQYSGRKLNWLHHMCQGELKLNYLKNPYLITMSTYQMALLLHFEHNDKIVSSELQEMTMLNDDNYNKHIQSLIDVKLITMDTPSVCLSSQFSLNFGYSNKRTKFRITHVVAKEANPVEVQQTHSAVDEDRKLFLQASVVRIMKSRKLIKHNNLIQEVISQSKSRFTPSVQMIKKCIETLIDKQYLERTPDTTDQYSYVA